MNTMMYHIQRTGLIVFRGPIEMPSKLATPRTTGHVRVVKRETALMAQVAITVR